MNQDRKNIVINEILYWRKNKLLPEAYCNFLLSLYTEGEGVESKPTSSHSKKNTLSWIFGIGLLLPVMFLVTYFTEISPTLQMLINFIFIIICTLGLILNRNNPFFVHFASIILALFILLLTVNGSDLIFKGHGYYLFGIILLNCVCWIIVGILSKKKYFLIAGILGSITSGILIFNF
ncbi:hypothetical protein E1I69_00870 [Bacillus timonensis]|uniref:DUF2157 domain-containing protein n=1 Tax=Bacillus timonensis TaxID=1033734 RepID=A0A4S3PZP3_9BACI|nr:hypothetical protein [Bacillus timonensis]THE15437.1 hypothetical protein E1I69_00870 [Bacillus timonensis]